MGKYDDDYKAELFHRDHKRELMDSLNSIKDHHRSLGNFIGDETREPSEQCRKCGAKAREHCRHSIKPNPFRIAGKSVTEYVIQQRRRGGDFLDALGLR